MRPIDFTGAAPPQQFCIVLPRRWSASLHWCHCTKAVMAILCSSLCSHIIRESQCDLQAYITSQMSQHAHQEDSMIEGKEHGIWCQKEQVQFLYPLLPYLSL